jgi:hypothetical protein
MRFVLVAVLPASFLLTGCAAQRADDDFVPRVARPAFPREDGPVVCIDAGHENAHTAGGLYAPFAALLRADGYRVVSIDTKFDRGVPRECRALAIVNAAGGRTYHLFGLNLPTKSRARRHLPAFTVIEIDSVRSWVARGGGLLLVADHYPYGSSAATLGAAFDVDMSGGYTEAGNVDPAGRDRGQLLFSRDNGLLATHPITEGRSADERVRRVVTFTGQSLRGPAGSALLTLGDSAVDLLPPPPTFTPRSAEGRTQGLALVVGAGRAVVLGEAAALTAQVSDKGTRFGMQRSDNDNARFALNIVRWLTHVL